MPRCLPVRATEGIVHVWQANLAGAEADGLDGLLCAEERERAARIVTERDRILWARSRGVLRVLLGRYLDRDPRALRFVLGPHGKPELLPEGPAPVAPLRFNLSHSGAIALYAVTVGREVGVDIERVRERYTTEFLREWVAREATVKCGGSGLLMAPADTPADALWTTRLDVGPGAAAAITVEGGQCELRCWSYTPPVSVACSALAAKAPPGSSHSPLTPPQI
jgi:phosphopantetheinyl transferase